MTMDRSSGEAVARAFTDAWSAGDADALAALFVPDADFVNVVGFWWRSARQIRKAHDYGFRKMFAEARLTILDIKQRALSADIHLVHGVIGLDGQIAPDGSPAGARVTVMSLVAKRQVDGDFLLVSVHNTDRVEGADTHIRDTDGFRPADYS